MRAGIWVLNIFAAIWGAGSIVAGYGAEWLAVVPIAISVALIVWSSRQSVGTGDPARGGNVGRIVGIASAIEGVAIFGAAAMLGALHMPTLLLPVVAIIVGLHFFPLARWIPVPLYYRTGTALIVVGLVAMLAPPPDRAIATGIAAAIVLWVTGVLLVRHGRG